MKKIDEMKAKLSALRKDVQALLDENKIAEAKGKMQEVKDLQDAIKLQKELDENMKDNMENKGKEQGRENPEDKTKKNANIIRAMIKKVSGKSLTEAENALLLPTVSSPNGENGEGYILPQDIQTKIHQKVREYRSLRDVLGYIPAGTLSGSFPIEKFETVDELLDFTDGVDGKEVPDIEFTTVQFTLKEKGGFIKLSNTLLAMSDNALIEYVAEWFAKKAVKTENNMALTVIKSNKTVKTISTWKELKSSINVDLDPAALAGTVIVTNQDGFDFLDQQEDANGRPILQPDPSDATKKRFGGYRIEAYSNSDLPTTDGKAPIFYGNLKEGAKFVDWNGQVAFKASSEAGFWSNTTVARLIEFVDVIQVDSSDKCYVYGEIETTAATSTTKSSK